MCALLDSRAFGGEYVYQDHVEDPTALTPVEKRGDVWVKRDDKFIVGGVPGGKVRTCWHLAQGAKGLVTAGSRSSPQVNIVAHIAKKLGIPCRVHTPEGQLSPEVLAAKQAGAEVIQHRAGYNNVIIARAREDAKKQGWREIPFGMDCWEAVMQTRGQVKNLPREAKRIVIPVGSAMSLSGLLHGLLDIGWDVPVLGVVVGADPTDRLNRYAPRVYESDYDDAFFEPDLPVNARDRGWGDMVTLERSPLDYHQSFKKPYWRGIALDPIYEAKALPFIEPGDLFWVIGVRQTHMQPDTNDDA